MTAEDRAKIETCVEIVALINSDEWANDSAGLLQRKYYEICQSLSLSDGAAEEWLHEGEE